MITVLDHLIQITAHVAVLICGLAVVLWCVMALVLWSFEQVLVVFRIAGIFRRFLVQDAYRMGHKADAARAAKQEGKKATTRSPPEGL